MMPMTAIETLWSKTVFTQLAAEETLTQCNSSLQKVMVNNISDASSVVKDIVRNEDRVKPEDAASGIWPPPFEVHLLHETNFSFPSDTLFSNDEAEMIQPQDLRDFGLHIEDLKNIQANEIPSDDYIFVGKEENESFRYNYLETQNYEDKKQGNQVDFQPVMRRETETEYNYEDMNKEYKEELVNASKSNMTFKYEKDEETSEKINCDEASSFWIKGIKCFWEQYIRTKSKKTLLKLFAKTVRFLSIWISVYVVIGLTCWCKRGWCCWCFMCCFKFCRPRKTINIAKEYVATNPPGLIVIDEDNVIEYTPNDYELEAYRKFNNYMRKI